MHLLLRERGSNWAADFVRSAKAQQRQCRRQRIYKTNRRLVHKPQPHHIARRLAEYRNAEAERELQDQLVNLKW